MCGSFSLQLELYVGFVGVEGRSKKHNSDAKVYYKLCS
jgi:hypothetical protein